MSNYDYSAFADGQLAEVLAGNRERTAWARQAGTLQGQLETSLLNDKNNEFLKLAFKEIVKDMLKEIQAVNPSSKFADKEHINMLLKKYSDEIARDNDMLYDSSGSLSYRY